jgi:alpha-1,6-mannosyltransferase
LPRWSSLKLTGDVIGPAVVIMHRLISIIGPSRPPPGRSPTWRAAAGCRSRRPLCGSGILNPLVLLHLVAGVHNEAVMMGLLLCGVELGLRSVDWTRSTADGTTVPPSTRRRWTLGAAAVALICCAGMVKVTAFLALGFVGVAVARFWGGRFRDLVASASVFVVAALAVVSAVSLGSGLGLGWILVQGGATEIISWMSLTTDIGLFTSGTGRFLGLGDHTETALNTARVLGLLIGGFWIIRMLWASFRGRIHPVGGLGVATFMLVVFFPVVHPWYVLWAIMPLSAWANQRLFRLAVVVYSVVLSFFILPRGLNLPPGTVAMIYLMSAVASLVVIGVGWLLYQRRRATS